MLFPHHWAKWTGKLAARNFCSHLRLAIDNLMQPLQEAAACRLAASRQRRLITRVKFDVARLNCILLWIIIVEKPVRKTFRRAAQPVDVQTMMTIAFEMGSRGQDCRELNFSTGNICSTLRHARISWENEHLIRQWRSSCQRRSANNEIHSASHQRSKHLKLSKTNKQVWEGCSKYP